MFGRNDLNFMANEKPKHENGAIDPVAALQDVQVGEESLLVTSANFDMLVTACENIEAGVALGEAIAAKGDESTGVAVANESLRQNLAMIGQEHIVSAVVTPGTESIVAANEGIGEMLKKAWEKTKEIAMKIWKWILDLVGKVGHFLSSLVGKGDTTYERLVKLVKKHKDAKTTNLDGQEFSESVQKAINNKFKLLSLTGDVSSGSIGEFISSQSTLMEAVESMKNEVLQAQMPMADIENMMKYAQGFTENGGNDKEDVVTIANMVKGMIKTLPVNSSKLELDNDASKVAAGFKNIDILDAAEQAVGDVEGGVVSAVGMSFDKLRCLAVCVTTEAKDAMADLEKLPSEADAKPSKAFSLANKIANGIKVVEFIVAPEASEYEDNFKDVEPLEFTEVETLKNDMKDLDKTAAKVIKGYGAKISKEKKDMEKLLKSTMKEIDKSASPISDKVKSLIGRIINAKTKIAKAVAAGVTSTAKDMVTSPVYDYAVESAKLYKKD